MCNINLIFRKDKMIEKRINSVINVMSYESFKTNNDGQGFVGLRMNDGEMIYSLDKTFGNHAFSSPAFLVMSHQRFATSGSKNPQDNLQPIESKDFIILHNGVISSLGTDEKSDTYELLDKLQESYSKYGDAIKSIKDVMEDIYGSYSILLFNKSDCKLYYFKNNYTSFFKAGNSKYLVLSTDKDNVDYASEVLGINKQPQQVTSGLIYSVLDNFTTVGELKIQYYSDCSVRAIDYDDDVVKMAMGERGEVKTVKSNFDSSIEEDRVKYFIDTYYNSKVIDIVSSLGSRELRILVRNVDLEMYRGEFKFLTIERTGELYTAIKVPYDDVRKLAKEIMGANFSEDFEVATYD